RSTRGVSLLTPATQTSPFDAITEARSAPGANTHRCLLGRKRAGTEWEHGGNTLPPRAALPAVLPRRAPTRRAVKLQVALRAAPPTRRIAHVAGPYSAFTSAPTLSSLTPEPCSGVCESGGRGSGQKNRALSATS